MLDTSDNAIRLATELFGADRFKATRWCPGDIKGEWLVVDDTNELAAVVQLYAEEQVLDGFDYESTARHYGPKLDMWMRS